ncbi:hypothetical protein J5N97_014006 [Dioscorea zingiberensis]|uniref:Uncharacterized protein n=1 Tax=Dioscorea zingiberensis TaxID=325984 RepID=A0A9D5CT61_9LILI|nr:hypothetical protein J5N97_014006 [Dioscorea zingiberensis]
MWTSEGSQTVAFSSIAIPHSAALRNAGACRNANRSGEGNLAGESEVGIKMRGSYGFGRREGLERREEDNGDHGGGEETGHPHDPEHPPLSIAAGLPPATAARIEVEEIR